MRSFLLILFLFISVFLSAQTAHNFRKNGDREYSKGAYPEAEERYRKALEKDPETKGHFNLGNTLFNQQRYEEALDQYDKAIARTDDPMVQSRAYYNKGNAYFNQQKLNESIESYKKALRLNIMDEDARKNLYLTRQLLKQQEQEQNKEQKQQEQDQEQSEQEKDPNQNKNEDDSQNEQNEEQEQQQQAQSEKQEQNEEQEQQQNEEKRDSSGLDSLKQKQITRDELMKLLKAIEDEDKKIQQKLRRGSSQKKKSDKDW